MARIVPCYRGPNPADAPERRIAIWKWAKENAIDQGADYDKVASMINQHFFGGKGKPEWIADILSGRKTPYRQVADDLWKAQANRRAIIQQAKQLSDRYKTPAIFRPITSAANFPRKTATFLHSVVFPLSHAGDLLPHPTAWASFFRGMKNTYGTVFGESGGLNIGERIKSGKALHARMMTALENHPLFRAAVESGLDVGKNSHDTGMASKLFGGDASNRAWDMLKMLRFELWQRQMQKLIEPGMSHEEVVNNGKEIAGWANHATGSTKTSLGKAGSVLFGPKLTMSKLARLTVDPAKTIGTFLKMATGQQTTAGERAAAKIRLSGAAQYVGTLAGFLATNQGLLMATGSKQNINFDDPTKSDFLKFKVGGVEIGLPGLRSEIKTIGQMLAVANMSSRELKGEPRQSKMNDLVGQYIMSKVNPAIGLGKDVLYGQDWQGRPMPWSPDPGHVTKSGFNLKRLDWPEFVTQHLPIILQGPAGYFYKHLKDNGASALDAGTIMKGIIMSGLGATGLHAGEESPKSMNAPAKGLLGINQAIRKAEAAHSLMTH